MQHDTSTRKRPTWLRYGIVALATALVVAPVAVYASDTFTDVPDSNIFHGDIQWMSDNGITAGCGGGGTLYCPKDNVSREQMSAFMRRLAENQVVEAATALEADHATTADSATSAADADTLDGLDSTELAPLVWAQTRDNDSNPFPATTSNVEVNSVAIDAPGDGVLVISGTTYFNNNSGGVTGDVDLQAKIDGVSIPAGTDQATTRLEADGSGHDAATLSYTVTIPVTAGAHVISQEVDPGITSDWFYNGNYLTVVFYPGGQGTLETTTSVATVAPNSGVDGS